MVKSWFKYSKSSQYGYLYLYQYEKKSAFLDYFYKRNWGYYTYDISNTSSNKRLGK